jgi:predicted DNA-binding protein (MmcQ/YjbR family)
MDLDRHAAAVKARLDAKPGAVAEPARVRDVLIYKLAGKMFAILSMRADAAVSLKCDPFLAGLLREQYAGVGHRYHLDRRHWISVTFGADVPEEEVERLVDQSYELVKAGLTRAQRAALEPASP